MNTTLLSVTGMSCMGCVSSVKNLLSALPGVTAVNIDLTSGRVEITHDPARTDIQALRNAIEAGGYSVTA